MYISEFWVGVGFTLIIELGILVIVAIRENKKGGK